MNSWILGIFILKNKHPHPPQKNEKKMKKKPQENCGIKNITFGLISISAILNVFITYRLIFHISRMLIGLWSRK